MPRYYIQLAANSSFAGRDFAKQRGVILYSFDLPDLSNLPDAYIQKARLTGSKNMQIIQNFLQKDLVRTRKLSSLGEGKK